MRLMSSHRAVMDTSSQDSGESMVPEVSEMRSETTVSDDGTPTASAEDSSMDQTPEVELDAASIYFWEEFNEKQHARMDKLLVEYRDHQPLFNNDELARTCTALGTATQRDVSSLMASLQTAALDPAIRVMRHLQGVDGLQAKFHLGTDLSFETITDGSNEPYYACTYKQEGHSEPTTAYIIVPVLPSDLPATAIREGLTTINDRNYEKTFCIPREFFDTSNVFGAIQAFVNQNFQNSLSPAEEAQVAGPLARTLRLMIDKGLTYGCFTTLDSFVFLKVKWWSGSTPVMFLFKCSEPIPDPGYFKPGGLPTGSNIIGFTVLALDSMSRKGPRGPHDRQRALHCLDKWEADLAFRQRNPSPY